MRWVNWKWIETSKHLKLYFEVNIYKIFTFSILIWVNSMEKRKIINLKIETYNRICKIVNKYNYKLICWKTYVDFDPNTLIIKADDKLIIFEMDHDGIYINFGDYDNQIDFDIYSDPDWFHIWFDKALQIIDNLLYKLARKSDDVSLKSL